LSKPNIEKLRKDEIKVESNKPKRTFKFGAARGGGDNTAF
jgi:hypothetical protein